jgi:DNA-binding CsgD family transcriptional regulator
MDSQVVDRIYECSFVPELWPGVLDELARITNTAGTSLFVSKDEVTAWTSSPIAREGTASFVKEGWFFRGQVIARLFAARHAGFLTDLDLFTHEELDLEPIYCEMWRPRLCVGWAVGTAIPLPTGETVTFVLSRLAGLGPIERALVQKLDELRPHLARSALMSARQQLERARAASQTLAAIGLAALVLDERGKVLAANSLIEAMTGHVLWRANDHLSLRDRKADQLLREAISTIDAASSASVRSFPVREADTQAAMIAHLIPIRLSARDIFVRCAAILVLTPVTAPKAPPVELVQSLFDLTPAEARVARSLANGKTIENIASDGGVSPNTIRTQVRGVLEKTGCSRQTDVVALLTGISPLG